MPDITYECAVNKSHPQKKFASPQQQTPWCCGKAMVQLQATATASTVSVGTPTSSKPQTPTTPKYTPSGTKSGQKR